MQLTIIFCLHHCFLSCFDNGWISKLLNKKVQISSYDISYVDINISEDIVVDKGACALLPDEFNHYVCADTTADGNCLYNAASCFLIKDDLLAVQLRLSVVLELANE